MSRQSLWQEFPELYHHLLPDWFREPYQPEALATCADCAMCRPEETRYQVKHYQPDLKCCTFYPDLPNYLVGAILCDTRPEREAGRQRIESAIQAGVGVSPYGITAPKVRELLYAHGDSGAFGNSAALLCPYFDREQHNCTIWAFRNAVCTTFFCKFNDGRAGHHFWSQVKAYLSFIQVLLSEVAAHALGMDLNALPENPLSNNERPVRLSAADLDGRVDDDAYRRLWAEHHGAEAEFYRACYRHVVDLDPDQVARLAGFQGQRLLAAVQNAKAAIDQPKLPQKLQRHPAGRLHEEGPEQTIAEGFNGLTVMPTLLWRFVTECDGRRPTEAVIAAFEEVHGVEIDRDLIANLVHNQFLREREPD